MITIGSTGMPATRSLRVLEPDSGRHDPVLGLSYPPTLGLSYPPLMVLQV